MLTTCSQAACDPAGVLRKSRDGQCFAGFPLVGQQVKTHVLTVLRRAPVKQLVQCLRLVLAADIHGCLVDSGSCIDRVRLRRKSSPASAEPASSGVPGSGTAT